MNPTNTHRREARKTLSDFVNDHDEVVRWLRNQDPYQVAEALSQALATAEARGAERVCAALEAGYSRFSDGLPASLISQSVQDAYRSIINLAKRAAYPELTK